MNEPLLPTQQDSRSYSTRPGTGSEIPRRDDPGACWGDERGQDASRTRTKMEVVQISELFHAC